MHPIRQQIHHDGDPYDGFGPESPFWQTAGPVQKWGGDDPIFTTTIAEHKPKLVIEVGSWKGDSAISMAKAAESLGLDTHILCVDTWLGNVQVWTRPLHDDWYASMRFRHGYPTIYYEFLSNVVRAGMQHRITPFPATSESAAIALKYMQVRAEVIYIDASHEYEDVFNDLKGYFPRLAIGGHIFGHDWKMPTVSNAVKDFAKLRGLLVQESDTSPDFWRLVQ